jgi:hypothetical protein
MKASPSFAAASTTKMEATANRTDQIRHKSPTSYRTGREHADVPPWMPRAHLAPPLPRNTLGRKPPQPSPKIYHHAGDSPWVVPQ